MEQQNIQPNQIQQEVSRGVKTQLVNIFQGLEVNDMNDLLKVERVAMKLATMSTSLDFAVANDGVKFPQLVKEIGKETALTQLCLVIKCFSETIRSKDKLRNSEIVEVAGMILQEFTAESLEDILMAFKRAKLRGEVFYHGLEQGKLFDLINTYLSEKAEWREADEKKKKAEFMREAHYDKSDGVDEETFKANMKRLQHEINIAAKKVKPVATNESYFNEKIKEALPNLSLEELKNCRKSYVNQSLYEPDRFKEQIGWIDEWITIRMTA